METLNLEKEIQADIERYNKVLYMYRSGARSGDVRQGGSITDNTKEVERHLENIIRELEALLRDK